MSLTGDSISDGTYDVTPMPELPDTIRADTDDDEDSKPAALHIGTDEEEDVIQAMNNAAAQIKHGSE